MPWCRGKYQDLNARAQGHLISGVPETPMHNLYSIPPFLLITPCYLDSTCVLIIFIYNSVKLGETEILDLK